MPGEFRFKRLNGDEIYADYVEPAPGIAFYWVIILKNKYLSN